MGEGWSERVDTGSFIHSFIHSSGLHLCGSFRVPDVGFAACPPRPLIVLGLTLVSGQRLSRIHLRVLGLSTRAAQGKREHMSSGQRPRVLLALASCPSFITYPAFGRDRWPGYLLKAWILRQAFCSVSQAGRIGCLWLGSAL